MERLVGEVAAAQRRERPEPDPRLARAVAEIARRVPADGPPSNEVVQAALWLHGIVEPPPHLIVLTMGSEGTEAMLAELREQLPRALAGGRYRRVAAATVIGKDQTHVVVALQESFVRLQPIARALLSGGPAWIEGRLLPPFQRPAGFVTSPDGKVARIELGGDGKRFRGQFHCGPARGPYQVELTAEDRFGATVLANFPIFCGTAAPAVLKVAAIPPEPPVKDAKAAEVALFRLLNADRQRAGLSGLALDPGLSAVARAHSVDMHAHGFVGHVSPSTGSASDRVRRAGVAARLVLENVARAYSPGEAERGLMASPGHRANILNGQATRVGIGAVLSDAPGGARELLVTQVFIRPPEPYDSRSPEQLRRRVAELRRSKKLRALDTDAALDQIAQATARDLAKGTLTTDRANQPIERALGRLGGRYRSVRSLFAAVSELGQVLTSLAGPLADRGATSIGIGVAPGRSAAKGPAMHVVLVLATRR